MADGEQPLAKITMAQNKTAIKVFLFVVLLIILAFAWVGSYWLKYHKWPWIDIGEAINRAYEKQVGGEDNQSQGGTQGEKLVKTEDELKSDLFRQGTMNDLAAKIGKVSPADPVLGGKWYVLRFWFADDRNVYVEYEDGHIMARILVEITGQEEKPEYKVLAYFEPGENDWVLKSGKDTMIGKRLDLYEYDSGKKEWVKKN